MNTHNNPAQPGAAALMGGPVLGGFLIEAARREAEASAFRLSALAEAATCSHLSAFGAVAQAASGFTLAELQRGSSTLDTISAMMEESQRQWAEERRRWLDHIEASRVPPAALSRPAPPPPIRLTVYITR